MGFQDFYIPLARINSVFWVNSPLNFWLFCVFFLRRNNLSSKPKRLAWTHFDNCSCWYPWAPSKYLDYRDVIESSITFVLLTIWKSMVANLESIPIFCQVQRDNGMSGQTPRTCGAIIQPRNNIMGGGMKVTDSLRTLVTFDEEYIAHF